MQNQSIPNSSIESLPVDLLTEHAISYIENIDELLEDVKSQCNYYDLVPNLNMVHYTKDLGIEAEIRPLNQDSSVIEDGNTKFQICFSANFGQFLWSVGLYLSSYMDNIVQIPLMNLLGTNTHGYVARPQDVEYANKQFFLGRQLVQGNNFASFWIGNHIGNPGNFQFAIEKANGMYCGSIAFIYAHEFAHSCLGHTQVQNTVARSIADEIEADNLAMDYIEKTFNSSDGFTYKAEVAATLSALLLEGADTISGGGTHPDMDLRIDSLMNRLNLHECDILWGFMASAIRLWLLVYGGFTPQEDLQIPPFESYKEMYETYRDKLTLVRRRRYPQVLPRPWEI